MRIVALDPGTHTGWAQLIDVPSDPDIQVRTYGPEPHHKQLFNALRLPRNEPDVVVCESFRYIPGQTATILDSVEYIGVARLYCESTNTPLAMQTPAHAKNLWTDTKLKKLGLFLPGKLHVHEMDAVRHLLYYMTVTKKDLRWVNQLK